MCLAQGPQRSDAGEARTRGPSVSSQALYHWAIALPLSIFEWPLKTSFTVAWNWKSVINLSCFFLHFPLPFLLDAVSFTHKCHVKTAFTVLGDFNDVSFLLEIEKKIIKPYINNGIVPVCNFSQGFLPQGGGGGGYCLFFCIRRLGPSIYRAPQKNIRNFKNPQKNIWIFSNPKKDPPHSVPWP